MKGQHTRTSNTSTGKTLAGRFFTAGTALLLSALIALVSACGDGGGGAAAPDVDPGPPPANGPVTPPAPLPPQSQPNQYASASNATAVITGVNIASPPVVEFTLQDGDGFGLTGLTSS
ncbi:MAG: hypothetical protein KDI36_13155, partial [Pseudomonadales bacterium]|nr:hypothetical protein [Pseudomonadales bacterium]